jgi:predicted O-linked N-acetylglucosamine transferase (SPINDLY family)
MDIDIAIDLGGFTKGSRTGIFALRAAPIQINYLGYPGTMGADYIDYLVADNVLVPEVSRSHYTEKIIYLPCFQVNDRKREISEKVFSRKELGLPESGFVFCCFNNSYKITPLTFDSWMRILKGVDSSVLWLSESSPAASENLRKAADARGVDSGRLVFAEKLPLLADHLARYRAADLFIDTLPYNAHTTASDALWAGLPVLTCTGEALASRVAASLLNAIEVPELITASQEEFEAMALSLARNPEQLIAIRRKIERNRLTTPLFHTEYFARHLEDAFTQIYDRYHDDLPPEHVFANPCH